MTHRTSALFLASCLLWLGGLDSAADSKEPAPKSSQPSAKAGADDAIDFTRARELFRRRQRGEKLSADDEAYLKRALASRNRRGAGEPQAPARRNSGTAPRETTGMKPLTEMTADDQYQGEDGGLYGGGLNAPPDTHLGAAEAELARIQPLDADGAHDPQGRIVFISISMSNATQEFSRFKRRADADARKSPAVTVVDCAQGGQAMAEWVDPDAPAWRETDRRLTSAGVTAQQVQTAWIKLANKSPAGSLEEHGRKLQRDTQTVIQNAKARFPNLRIVYLSSRIYGGYATGSLNPEPYAYESAFAVRWLIQDQIAGKPELNFAPARGPVNAPLLLWGPYLWADGTTPRIADNLSYARDDLAGDGTHPSDAGRDKVASLLLDFFKTDSLARPWFVGSAR